MVLHDARLGAIGGFIAYMFDYIKAVRAIDSGVEVSFVFRWSSLFILVIMGAFVAHLVGTVIGSETYARDIVIALSGMTAYNIIFLADSRFAEVIMNKFLGKVDKKDER